MIVLLKCIIAAVCITSRLVQSDESEIVSEPVNQKIRFENVINLTNRSGQPIELERKVKDLSGLSANNQFTKAGQSKSGPSFNRKTLEDQHTLKLPEQKKFQGFKLLEWKRRRKRFLDNINQRRIQERPTGKTIHKRLSESNNNCSEGDNVNEHLFTLKRETKSSKTHITQTKVKDVSKDFSSQIDSQLASTTTKIQNIHSVTDTSISKGISSNENSKHYHTKIQDTSDRYDENSNNVSLNSKYNDTTRDKINYMGKGEYDGADSQDELPKDIKSNTNSSQQCIVNSESPSLNASQSSKDNKYKSKEHFIITNTTPDIFLSSLDVPKNVILKTNLYFSTQRSMSGDSNTEIASKQKKHRFKISLFKRTTVTNFTACHTTENQQGFVSRVTPPNVAYEALENNDYEKSECHPKAAGPLSPLFYDQGAVCAKSNEDVEDALTGKLADRVVEVVMAKVSKDGRMVHELGLCNQGNISCLLNSIVHPESKQESELRTSENLKISVLEDIAAAIDRLTCNQAASGVCLKPPTDLLHFLGWLVSENSEDTPGPPQQTNHEQGRRDAYFIFRTNSMKDHKPSSLRQKETCNWDDWLMYREDGTENEEKPYSDPLSLEDSNIQQRLTRNTGRCRKERHADRHNHRVAELRRRRYTPWSLCDIP